MASQDSQPPAYTEKYDGTQQQQQQQQQNVGYQPMPQPGSQYQQQPMPQPQPQYQQYPIPQPGPTVLVTSSTVYPATTQFVTVIPEYSFGESPVSMTCQFCHQSIVTSTKYVAGSITWITFFVMLLFVIFWLCLWVPFVMKGTKDVVHSCPNCHKTVGYYRRSS